MVSYLPAQPPSPGTPKYYDSGTIYSWRYGDHASGRTGSIPPFRHTNYNTGTKSTRNYLVRRIRGCGGVKQFFQYGHVAKVVTTCTPFVDNVTSNGPVYSEYYLVRSQSDFAGYNTYTKSAFSEGDVISRQYEVQNQLIAEAASQYDALTDIAQLGEIPQMIGSISHDIYKIMRTLQGRYGLPTLRAARPFTPLELLRHPYKVFRKLGDEWMTYRYGIMTLVYSYRDLMKSIKRGKDVTTRRNGTVVPTETGQSLPPLSQGFFLKTAEGTILIRGTAFQFFENSELAQMSGIGFNPLVTAWEMIPYSFVVDWFVNVGDWLRSSVSQTFATQKWACLSRRDQTSTKTLVHLPIDDQSVAISNMKPINWYGADPPATPNVILPNPEGYFLLTEEKVDAYSRQTIPFSTALPTWNPSLSWRRILDSAAMSLQQLGRFSRSLR